MDVSNAIIDKEEIFICCDIYGNLHKPFLTVKIDLLINTIDNINNNNNNDCKNNNNLYVLIHSTNFVRVVENIDHVRKMIGNGEEFIAFPTNIWEDRCLLLEVIEEEKKFATELFLLCHVMFPTLTIAVERSNVNAQLLIPIEDLKELEIIVNSALSGKEGGAKVSSFAELAQMYSDYFTNTKNIFERFFTSIVPRYEEIGKLLNWNGYNQWKQTGNNIVFLFLLTHFLDMLHWAIQ